MKTSMLRNWENLPAEARKELWPHLMRHMVATLYADNLSSQEVSELSSFLSGLSSLLEFGDITETEILLIQPEGLADRRAFTAGANMQGAWEAVSTEARQNSFREIMLDMMNTFRDEIFSFQDLKPILATLYIHSQELYLLAARLLDRETPREYPYED